MKDHLLGFHWVGLVTSVPKGLEPNREIAEPDEPSELVVVSRNPTRELAKKPTRKVFGVEMRILADTVFCKVIILDPDGKPAPWIHGVRRDRQSPNKSDGFGAGIRGRVGVLEPVGAESADKVRVLSILNFRNRQLGRLRQPRGGFAGCARLRRRRGCCIPWGTRP